MLKKLILFVVFITFVLPIAAEEPPDFLKLRERYGIFADFDLNVHLANFKKLPNIPNCCQSFSSGFGTGFSAGILYEHPLGDLVKNLFNSTDYYGLTGQIRLVYDEKSALLSATEPTYVYFQPLDTALPGEFEHRLDAKLSTISIEPILSYRVYEDLTVNFGFQIGTLLTKKFDQYEEITKPVNSGTFLDAEGNDTHSYIRNKYDGEIPLANAVQAGIIAGASYELPLNAKKTLLLTPELLLNIGLTKMVQGLTWRSNSVRVGLSIKYSPKPEKPLIFQRQRFQSIDTISITDDKHLRDTVLSGKEHFGYDTTRFENVITYIDTIYRIDTLVKAIVPELYADIKALSQDESGSQYPLDTLKIEEFISQKTSPLLNYVFFDENSKQIPARYKTITPEETDSFSEEILYKNTTLQYYYNILNIIGRRMNQYPNSKITLKAINSGIGDKESSRDIFNERAQTVKRYFTDIWKIDPDRIKTQVEFVSSNAPTAMTEQEKAEEMRRVEITSNVWDVIKPVFSRDTIVEYRPAIISFVPEVYSDAGVSNWKIDVAQDRNNLVNLTGTGFPASSYEMNVSEKRNGISEAGNKIRYYIDVTDQRGQVFKSDTKVIPYQYTSIMTKQEEKIEDVVVGRYSLILFDFDKADISAHNKRIIEFIKGRITPESRITITGYTDAIGDEDYNQRLSEERAKSVANAIGFIAESIKGLGETMLLYDVKLPEGRFYCRTVEITIETKVPNK